MNCPECGKPLRDSVAFIEPHHPDPNSLVADEPICPASNMPHPDLHLEQALRDGMIDGRYGRKQKYAPVGKTADKAKEKV